ncbi:MAG: hypothetical protein Q9195_003645 [Heterodermia aff. obscurata]
MSAHPITIIGAGLAGLTLGRCLRQYGIPAVVFERVSSSPRYNYGITLHPWAYRPLLKLLQSDEAAFREKLAIDSTRDVTGALSSCALTQGLDTDPGTFHCHRGRLEKWLQQEQDIQWEKSLEDIEATTQKIILHLKDNETVETEVVIGTDGPHSQIRKSLAPDIKLQYRHKNIVLEISINEFSVRYVDLSYTYSRPVHEDDQLHKPDRPIPGATDIPEEFYTELNQLETLPSPYNTIFDSAKVRRDRVLHWLMRTTLGTREQIKSLTDRGVLLIGDAIHATPILGGEGANMALKDGVDLAEHIVRHGTKSLLDFSNEKYQTWQKGVEESEKRITEMHDPTKASL